MKRIIFSLLLISVLWDASAYVGRDHIQNRIGYKQLKKVLVKDQAWNPYPGYADRAGWDAMTGEHKAEIISYGEGYLDYRWQVVKATDYIEFERSGSRDIMEKPYRENMHAIACLFCAELAEGKGRFVPQIADGVFHFCEMSSWALSAHLHKFSHARTSMPFKDDNTLELHQGDLSQLFAWIYHYLHSEFDKLHPEISRRLKSEIVHREMDPYLEHEDYWWMGFTRDRHIDTMNNWTPWCSLNALVTFMLMEDDPDRLARAVWKSIQSVDYYLNFIQEDGGIEEGPIYWNNAAGKLYDYLTALKMITGGQVSIFDVDQVRRMGEYIAKSYVGDGWVVNFADSPARPTFRNSALVYRYGKAVDSPFMMTYAALARKVQDISYEPSEDVFRFFEQLAYDEEFNSYEAEYVAPEYTWYPETAFHFHKAGDLFFAASAGHNKQSHNHNDVGTFSLYYRDRPMIIDVGVGTYTRQTFSDERYSIWTMQSGYHNVPMINGVMQKDGREYAAKEVVSGKGYFSADISGAYPSEAAVLRWIRSYKVKGKTIEIADEFVLDKATAQNEIVFMTWGSVQEAGDGLVTIEVDGQKASLRYSASDFEAVVEPIVLKDPKLTEVWGEEICRVRLIARKLQKKSNYKYRICF